MWVDGDDTYPGRRRMEMQWERHDNKGGRRQTNVSSPISKKIKGCSIKYGNSQYCGKDITHD